ncbi:unnamed protein product [Rhizophagus irregularis]|nr:unnamed protein product [Rhizophagus irregularis]
MPKAKTKKICKKVPKEITEYPNANNILYTDGNRSYYYTVIQEGLYPQPPVLAYTQGKNKYKIPDCYCIETTWGRGENKRTIKCSINYIEGKPFFKIMYGGNFSEEVHSNTSSTAAANAVIKKLFPNNEKTLISGVHVFGIHLETLRKARENCCPPLRKLRSLKSIEFCSKSTILKRQQKFGYQLKQYIQDEGVKFYGENQVVLKKVSYNVSNMDFQINYETRHDKENEEKLTLMVEAIDKNYIPREGYRALAAIESNLEREWAVSDQKHKITKNMNRKIPITIINIPTSPVQDELIFAENSDIFDPEVIEGIHNIKNGGYRSVKDILSYIVPVHILNGILDTNDPIIHLRISGNGRNVGRKIKHVMVTIAILNDIQNIYKPDYHYTVVLFPGVEKYELFEVIMAPFIQELDDLKNYGLKINEIIWKFEFYFSSDWKFLAICLGFNSPNSNFFCL